MYLYEYGGMAWIWRALILLGMAFSSLFGWMGLAFGMFWLALVCVGFAAFLLALGGMAVTRVKVLATGELQVETLIFIRRVITPERLGKAYYRGSLEDGRIAAPRIWVLVRGGLPLYLDLLATIPDTTMFNSLFRLDPSGRPRQRGRRAPSNDWDVPYL